MARSPALKKSLTWLGSAHLITFFSPFRQHLAINPPPTTPRWKSGSFFSFGGLSCVVSIFQFNPLKDEGGIRNDESFL